MRAALAHSQQFENTLSGVLICILAIAKYKTLEFHEKNIFNVWNEMNC